MMTTVSHIDWPSRSGERARLGVRGFDLRPKTMPGPVFQRVRVTSVWESYFLQSQETVKPKSYIWFAVESTAALTRG